MKKRNLIASILITILCTLVFVGWVATQYLWRDTSLITGIPCDPPCWQGIIPGVTSKEDALEILERSPYIKTGSIRESGTSDLGGCLWKWRIPGKRTQPSISWQNGIVETITLGLTFELNVQEVIDHFGTPDAINIAEGGTPEYWYWRVTFYYPSQGIEFSAFTNEFDNEIKPSTEVGIASLFNPKSMDERAKELEYKLDYPLPDEFFIQWEGYGNVIEIYTGNQNK